MALALLIETIIIMVLVSIRPFVARKLWPFIVGLICLFSFSCFAESLYVTVRSTPYDRQMARINPVLLSAGNSDKQNLSLSLVNHWIEDLRAIPYGFTPQWKTPEELEIRFFAAAIVEGDLVPCTFEKIAWVLPRELGDYDFLAANAGLVANLATGRIKPAQILEGSEDTGASRRGPGIWGAAEPAAD